MASGILKAVQDRDGWMSPFKNRYISILSVWIVHGGLLITLLQTATRKPCYRRENRAMPL